MTEAYQRQDVFRADARWPSAHAASVVVLPGGGLMASWFAGSREGAPDAAVWASEYGSQGWSAPNVIVDTPGQPDGNSVLWLDDEGVLRVWYVTMEGRGWATCSVRERRSSDGGRTWGSDRAVREEWGWMVRNEPVRWQGRLLMPMYDERDWSAFVLVSEDGGDTWDQSAAVRADAGVIQPALAPLRDGRLLMLLRSRGGSVYRSISPAGDGKLWTKPRATALPNPNSAVELISLESGVLLSIFNPTKRGRSPLRVALSDDDGEHWNVWRDIENEPGEFSYPTAVQTPDGLIHALYTWHRKTITHVRFDEAWVRDGA